MNCSFITTPTGVQCRRCGQTITTTDPPDRCHAVCPRGPCRHLGDLSRLTGCESCGGSVQIKVFACAVHTECTLGKLVGNVACCATCGDYESQPPAGGA